MKNNLFNNNDDMFKHMTKIFGAFFVIWAVWVVVIITVLGLIGWVAYHFISKGW